MRRYVISLLVEVCGVAGLIAVFYIGAIAQETEVRRVATQDQLGTVITNSIGMKFAHIPPGAFLMGTSKEEIEQLPKQFPGVKPEMFEYEYPPHRVRITKPFYLGVYDVTQAEYELVMGTNPSEFSKGGSPLWADTSGMDTARFPVENITWDEAVEFCQKLSLLPEEQRAGRVYRLPTEAEWEYACRAGTTTPFHFGSELNGQQANCDGTQPYGTSTKGPSLRRTSEVGSYKPNAFGLYDMHGNVAEWCRDWHGRYPADSVDDPAGPSDGSRRVIRGGYWFGPAGLCRAAYRSGSSPSGRAGNVGFRVVLQSNSSAPVTTNAESEITKPVTVAPGGEPTNGVKPASKGATTPSTARSHPVGLDGVWKTISAEGRGKPLEQYVGFEFQFSANQVVMTGALQRYTMTFTVDSSKKPSCMNVSGSDEKTMKWIYDVTGDTLRLCWNARNPTERPKSFLTHGNSDSVLLTLKRTGDVDRLPRGEDSWSHYLGGGMYATGSPSMSPDGLTIVFSSPRTGNGDIYSVDRDGSNRTRLTESPAFEADPVFSPDGLIIAFVREADGCRHIWLMDKDGSNQRQLTVGDVLDDLRSFSHDGSGLHFWRTPVLSGGSTSMFAVSILSADESIRRLEGFPCSSPDGKRIAYDMYDETTGRSEIWLANADGSNKRSLTEGLSPSFSPDGTTILYSSENEQPGSLWMMIDTDGSNERKLGMLDRPKFAPDGKHIVCFSPEWQRQIWKMELDGSNRERLQAPTAYATDLRPCRDGFIFLLVGSDRVGDIYVVDTNAWTAKRVTSTR